MIFLDLLTLLVGDFVKIKDLIDFFLFRRVWLNFVVHVQVALLKTRNVKQNVGHFVHLADAFGELSFLDFVFKGHFDELFVVFLVVLCHLLKVELGSHHFDFRLVEPQELLTQFV